MAGILTFGGSLEISPSRPADRHAITDALGGVRDAVPAALERLVPLVFDTFATADLVHETYLRLVDETRLQTEPETGESLGHTERTVAHDWVKAQRWWCQELRDGDA